MFKGGVIVGDSAVFQISIRVFTGWTNINVQLTGLAEGNHNIFFIESVSYYCQTLLKINFLTILFF
jgi:hypothetical protein